MIKPETIGFSARRLGLKKPTLNCNMDDGRIARITTLLARKGPISADYRLIVYAAIID